VSVKLTDAQLIASMMALTCIENVLPHGWI